MNLILTSNGLTTGASRTDRMMGDDTNTKMFGVFLYKRFAFHHQDTAPNVESIPFGYCNPKGYVHPRTDFQQRSDVAASTMLN